MEQNHKDTAGFADEGIARTYRRLRILASAALIGLPLLTAVAGLLQGFPLQYSLSDYYFLAEDGGLPRTTFIVFLAFLGGVLLAYRGLDGTDDRIHNVAGLFALGVAFFPMQCDRSVHPHCVPGLLPLLHLPSAGLLYASAMVSVWYAGGPKLLAALRLLAHAGTWVGRLRSIQRLSYLLMTVGILAFFVHALAPGFLDGFSWTFWIEYSGFLGFGIYWVLFMLLIDAANQEGRRQFPGPHAGPAPKALEEGAQPGAPAPAAKGWVDIP